MVIFLVSVGGGKMIYTNNFLLNLSLHLGNLQTLNVHLNLPKQQGELPLKKKSSHHYPIFSEALGRKPQRIHSEMILFHWLLRFELSA